jgi:hypothetical protein
MYCPAHDRQVWAEIIGGDAAGFDKAVDAATRADPLRFRADRSMDAGAYRDGGTPVALRTLNLLLRGGAAVGDEADPGHLIEAAVRYFLGKL